MIDKFTVCRICGYKYNDYYPWGKDGGTPTYDICVCCGIEFGYEDDNLTEIRKSRQKWIENGMKCNEKGINNDFSRQLKNIPAEWK